MYFIDVKIVCLKRIYSLNSSIHSQGIKEVELVFRSTLRIVKTPLVIILDSLDQLDTTYNARTVGWIPALTLPHVRFVVSTLEDPKYEAFPNLKVINVKIQSAIALWVIVCYNI